MSKLLQLLE